MANPLITVAIPIYNAEKYLDFAIKSTLNQTYTDFELLLINDGSTDRSLSIMQKYDYDPRVKIVNDGQNKGLVYRLNQSIDLAKGEYYARMDADDIMHPERLQKQIDFLETNPSIHVLGSSIYCIDEVNMPFGRRNLPEVIDDKIKRNYFCHPTVIAHTEWFQSNKYNPSCIRMEDLELWQRTQPFYVFHNMTDCLLFYRETKGSLNKYSLSTKSSILFSFEKIYNLRSFFIFLKDTILKILKLTLMCVFVLMHKEDILIKRRSSKISNKEQLFILELINKITK